MKKIIFVIMVLISVQGYAYEKGPGFYAEFGRSLLDTHYMNQVGDSKQYVSYTDLEVHYVFQFWNIQLIPYGGVKTWFLSGDNVFRGGKPFCDIYSFGSKIKYGNAIIYYEHYCAHQVYSNKEMWKVEDYRMGQNSDRIAIRYEFN
jgi:hypothetical protein